MNKNVSGTNPVPLLALAALLSTSLPAQELNDAPALAEWEDPVTGMRFMAAPAGCFQMGNPAALTPAKAPHLEQAGHDGLWFADEAPVHQACVDSFWIARHEVTAAQWRAVMGSPPPLGEGEAPAAGINWQQASTFIKQLNTLSDGPIEFRLPSEAEWEYACRSGEQTPVKSLPSTSQLKSNAWFHASLPTSSEPQPVGQLAPNAWGLQDMLGNVWEWVEDSYSRGAYIDHTRNNPINNTTSSARVIRGASFRSMSGEVRCTSRSSYAANSSLPQIGLRVAGSPRP